MINWFKKGVKNSNRAVLVTAVRDEAPYLVEWLAHYRALGVDRIDVYCNHCSDETVALLKTLSANFDWIRLHESDVREGQRPQMVAQRDLLANDKWSADDWVLFFDCDEFLVIHNGTNIKDILNSVGKGVGQVVFNWRVFGSNGCELYEPEWVTHRFTSACLNLNHRQSKVVKSAYRPVAIENPGIHRPDLLPGWEAGYADGSSATFMDDGAVEFAKVDVAQLNHYITRSKAEFCFKQIRGGGGGKWSSESGQPISKAQYTKNFFERVDSLCSGVDQSIRCHDVKVTAVLDELLSNSSVVELHSQAISSAASRNSELLDNWNN